MDEKDGALFCYEKVDSLNYIVWFGTTLGEGIYYYSDTKQWEDRLRAIPGDVYYIGIHIEHPYRKRPGLASRPFLAPPVGLEPTTL